MEASFIEVTPISHFPLQNLPYGVFSTAQDPVPRIGVAIGEQILDVKAISRAGLFTGPHLQGNVALEQSTLNDFMSLGRPAWREARATLHRLLSAEETTLRDNTSLRAAAFTPQSTATMHLPAAIGDYTDFFCSKEHASNCGLIFRGPENALNPNWLHLPVAYHGRASSIVVSGTDVRRPWGQVRRKSVTGEQQQQQQQPSLEPSALLDFELELGCFIGPGNKSNHPVSVDAAVDQMFGFVLVNDWSARDIQAWEYIPLGPFTAKNWATSISPWVVTMEALEPFQAPAPCQDPLPLPYLRSKSSIRSNYDIRLEVSLTPEGRDGDVKGNENGDGSDAMRASVLTRSNMKTLYWTVPQLIAHHTVTGCNLRPGDLVATGTLSAEGEGAQGCMLELSWNGSRKVQLVVDDGGGEKVVVGERTFLEDGDVVTMTGYCQGEGYRVGFGECIGKVLPAVDFTQDQLG